MNNFDIIKNLMDVKNDKTCSWINDLNPRSNIKVLQKNEDCEWLIMERFTGLSAARKLGQLYPKQNIYCRCN